MKDLEIPFLDAYDFENNTIFVPKTPTRHPLFPYEQIEEKLFYGRKPPQTIRIDILRIPGTIRTTTKEPTDLIRDWDYLLDEDDC